MAPTYTSPGGNCQNPLRCAAGPTSRLEAGWKSLKPRVRRLTPCVEANNISHQHRRSATCETGFFKGPPAPALQCSNDQEPRRFWWRLDVTPSRRVYVDKQDQNKSNNLRGRCWQSKSCRPSRASSGST